jgi:predicted MFS family arabinose efflux permease
VQLYREAYSGLPRPVWLLCLVTLVNRAGSMVLAFLALYLTTQRGLGLDEAGVLLALYGVGSAAGSFLGGTATDRFGPVPVQIAGLSCAGTGFIALGALESPAAIGAVLLLIGALGDAFRPANVAHLAAAAPPALRSRALALNRLAINLGVAIGPAVGGLLAVVDYAWLFLVDDATCLGAALLLWWFFRARPAAPAIASESELPDRSPWRDAPFLLAMALSAVVATVFLQVLGTLPVYLRAEYGLREDAIGLLFAVNPVLIVLFEMVLVHRLASRPPLPLVALGALLVGAGFAMLPAGPGIWWALATVVVWTVGEMLESPQLGTFVANRAGSAQRGRYMGLYILAFALAAVVAPVAGTAVYTSLGPTALWLLCGAAGFGAAAGFAVLASALRRQRG